MYSANAQNTILRIMGELNQCSYNPRMKDYISNLIYSTMNYPKKVQQARHFIKNMGPDRIMMVWYPLSIPFGGRNYNVPLQIYIMKNIPYEPPQIFLEVVQGSAANATNKDIDPKTNRVMTYSLRNWNQYSTIDNVMNEIYASFSKIFPIYKKSSQPSAPAPVASPPPVIPPSSNPSPFPGGGGIYGNLVGEVQNLYQQNTNRNLNYNFYNNNQNKGNAYGYQPPATNIYGKAMSNEGNKNYNNNNYNNYNNNYNNNNNQQPSSYGGGIYGNNNNYNNNNNNNNPQPNSFGGGIYGNNNNNNNNQQPNSFGGGIYGNNNNNNQNTNFGGGIYDQPKKDPNDEFKEILIEEVTSKIKDKLVAEKNRLNTQNNKMKKYKTLFSKENEKLQNFVNQQNEIKKRCDEDMNNMSNALERVKAQINQGKKNVLSEENCINFIEVPKPELIKIIASETAMEEMILIVRKAFEKKKISFDDTIMFIRNSSRDIFSLKFLKEKIIK